MVIKKNSAIMPRYGIAFDIGTTTIVGSLVNIDICKEIEICSLPNSQARWGPDVLSRILYATNDSSFLKSLQDAVINTCNDVIKKLTLHKNIHSICIAGNSAMQHLLLGISPAKLAIVPYKPAFKDAKKIVAAVIGLLVNSETCLYTFPLIGGFVGGDTVAGILSTGMHKRKGYSLLIDIGTNSEMVISSEKAIFATSTAAGPAFEGGNVKHGMIARNGAIQGVKIGNDKVIFDVIGDTTPEGICGSGIIDAISALLTTGIIDKTGRIKNRNEINSNIANKIIESKEGNGFIIYKDAKKEITITQKDVREIQLAKSAIQAGIKILLKRAQITADNIGRIFVAGAFGNNIKKENLAQIGILETQWLDRVIFVGDAALEGAKLALCSEEKQKEAELIAMRTKHVSLSGSKQFQIEYLKGMGF